MKLSIFTPTHDTKYLKELEETILNNTHKDWEWIILLNNGAKYDSNDLRIKVHTSKNKTSNIGALKKEACMHATGDILVEVDHDDLITTDCLSKLNTAFTDETVGFVYSDNAQLNDKFVPFNRLYGWTWKKYTWKGQEYISMNSMPITPGRTGHIWFAPDHVRAWRKHIYETIGGHRDDLEVCDDLDLIHRTYMVTKFKHIQEVLYLYRGHTDNTSVKKSQMIQELSMSIYYRDIEAMLFRFCDVNNLLKIDLCGGFNKPVGYTSIDLINGDIRSDLNKGIPLANNSCGIVRAYDALEHIYDKQFIMSEIHRVLAPGGMLLSETPSTDGRGAFQDPTHVSFWNQNSFWYYTRADQAKYIHNDKMFFESMLKTHFPSKWHTDNNICYVQAFLEKI